MEFHSILASGEVCRQPAERNVRESGFTADFNARQSKLLQPLPEDRVRGWNESLPFYMAYPGYHTSGREAVWLQDLEYLQQMYPNEVKRCQRRIAEILDKADYEGSMIYDEYPDRYSLQALAKSMLVVLEREEGAAPAEDMVQVLLCNEIYKRRHGGRRGSFYFA